MATTMFFEKEIHDQDGKTSIEVEFGRSSFYAGCELDNGREGTDSIYLVVDGKTIIMDHETAKDFVNSAAEVGRYFGFL